MVDRYEPTVGGDDWVDGCSNKYYPVMEQAQLGDYVEYCDYEELEKKYEALCKVIEQAYREI